MKDTKLIISIESLRESIDKSTSFGRNFVLSIVRGIGFAIGFSVLAGLVIGLLTSTFDLAAQVPLIGEYFSEVVDSVSSTEGFPAATTTEPVQ